MTSYPPAKRALDITIALPLLVVLSPVFAFLFVAMGIEMVRCARDRGPWLYREERISRGRAFELLKFRTVRSDVLSGMAADSHARMLEADERNLTWAGRRLLKPWYLDELPQLWNVVRGDMSLVGPRPWPLPMVANQVAQGLTYRNEFVAGWTGPAQVQKGVVTSAHYVALDLEYIETCRASRAAHIVRTDLGLLWASVRTLARGEGLQF
ncbi:MAG TPA: sugar transferase [Gaiellaceae bacterium]|nr:sugar transferase [Gaiellaceae bacterium]